MHHSPLLPSLIASFRHQPHLFPASTRPRVDLTRWRMTDTRRCVDSPPLHMLPPVASSAVFSHCHGSPKVVFSLPAILCRNVTTTRRSTSSLCRHVGSKKALVPVLLCCFYFFWVFFVVVFLFLKFCIFFFVSLCWLRFDLP